MQINCRKEKRVIISSGDKLFCFSNILFLWHSVFLKRFSLLFWKRKPKHEYSCGWSCRFPHLWELPGDCSYQEHKSQIRQLCDFSPLPPVVFQVKPSMYFLCLRYFHESLALLKAEILLFIYCLWRILHRVFIYCLNVLLLHIGKARCIKIHQEEFSKCGFLRIISQIPRENVQDTETEGRWQLGNERSFGLWLKGKPRNQSPLLKVAAGKHCVWQRKGHAQNTSEQKNEQDTLERVWCSPVLVLLQK